MSVFLCAVTVSLFVCLLPLLSYSTATLVAVAVLAILTAAILYAVGAMLLGVATMNGTMTAGIVEQVAAAILDAAILAVVPTAAVALFATSLAFTSPCHDPVHRQKQ